MELGGNGLGASHTFTITREVSNYVPIRPDRVPYVDEAYILLFFAARFVASSVSNANLNR